MKKIVISIAAIVTIVGSTTGGWWYVQHASSRHDEPKKATSSSEPIIIDTSSSNSSSQATPTTPAVVVDPSKFGEYDTHKNDKAVSYADITSGTGEPIAETNTVTVNYRGWLTNGTLFDQNVSSEAPFSFAMNGGRIIPGFAYGVLGMKAGGERLVIVPPELGYGAMSYASIPASSVLVFTIKVVSVQ